MAKSRKEFKVLNMSYLRDLAEQTRNEEFTRSFYDFYRVLKEFYAARLNRARLNFYLFEIEEKFKKSLTKLERVINKLKIKYAYLTKVSSVGSMAEKTWGLTVLA